MSTSDEKGLPAPTSIRERRLIRAAKRGDRAAQAELLRRYEPLVRRIARTLYMPGGESDDLAQCARLGILDAIRAWDPERRVPFRSFAWLCAVREARMVVNSARAGKHQPLNCARPLHAAGDDGLALEDTVEDCGRPDQDPVAKANRPRAAADHRRPRSEAHNARTPHSRAVGERLRPSRHRRHTGDPPAGRQQRAAARPPQAARQPDPLDRGAGRRDHAAHGRFRGQAKR
jgi:RNA polymerase sigma factor (sigma-70 family)